MEYDLSKVLVDETYLCRLLRVSPTLLRAMQNSNGQNVGELACYGIEPPFPKPDSIQYDGSVYWKLTSVLNWCDYVSRLQTCARELKQQSWDVKIALEKVKHVA